MKLNKEYNSQIEVNDLLDDAITNALIRRELADEALLALSDEETANIKGGSNTKISVNAARNNLGITVAGFKQVEPICPPIKPVIKPICPPTKPVIQPICPPVIAGLIFIPDDKSLDS